MSQLTKIFLAIILICATAQAAEKPLRSQEAPQEFQQQQNGDNPYVSRAMFTTRISNNEPVSDLYNIETDFDSVFFFTELMKCADCEFTHEWYYNGQKQFEVEAFSEWPRFRYWSSVNLKPSFTGTWTVKMFVEGDLFAEKSFNYYKETERQEQEQDIQQRLELNADSECEENLRYFSDQAKADPDEPYFQFMLDKWGARCLK